jgi:DNA-binding GntR family transcriptional regulator
VTTLAEQEFDEIVTIRSVLEPVALRHARERASSKDIAAMRRRLRDMERLAARRDQRTYIGKDYEFHVAIWELSGQPLLTEVLKRVSAPVFVFEAIMEKRYINANYDCEADAHAHRILVDYLEGKTDKDARACLQPVLDVAVHAEKPIVFDHGTVPESEAIILAAAARRHRPHSQGRLIEPTTSGCV